MLFSAEYRFLIKVLRQKKDMVLKLIAEFRNKPYKHVCNIVNSGHFMFSVISLNLL